MNKKDIVEIVNRRQKQRKESQIDPLKSKLTEVRKESKELQKSITNKYKDMAIKELEEKGFIVRSKNIELHDLCWNLETVKGQELEKEIDQLKSTIDKETQDFIDRILIFGMKDKAVKDMIAEFLGIEI